MFAADGYNKHTNGGRELREAMGQPLTAAPAVAKATDLLAAQGLSRSFGETQALRSCSLNVRSGEVHAIVGENGSGKSTLVKILCGVIPPDSGTIEFDGRSWRRLANPRIARTLGIVTVFQEVLVVEERSILENVWLGSDGMFLRRQGDSEKMRQAAEVFAELTDQPIDLSAPVKSVDLSARQLCVIARALLQQPRLLILDEATAALDISDRDRLFDSLRRRCGAGTAVIFISHRIDEIEEIADRITVLRSGESAGTLERRDAKPATLVRMMSGRDVADIEAESEAFAETAPEESPSALRLTEVRMKPDTNPVNLVVHEGEIIGIGGLEGHGQDGFLRVIVGLERPAGGTVERVTAQGNHAIRSVRQAVRSGIAYVPRDRATEGIFAPLSISANFALPSLGRYTRAGIISWPRLTEAWKKYAGELQIKFGRARNRVTTLSGGNQQKVIIARWLAVHPRVLVLNDPTRGVDIGTTQEVHNLLRELAAEGIAIILLSTEVSELLTIADRTLVFRDQQAFRIIPRAEATPERIISAMFGRRT